MTEPVLYQVRGPVGWVTLNRPEVLNAINDDVLNALMRILAEAAGDRQVRALVLTGAGRAFSAGGDIKAMQGMTEVTFRQTIRLYQRLSQSMRALDKPLVAAVNGYALGGGFELALSCDLRLAGEAARFGLPDIALGLSPTSGMTYLLTRAIGAGRAMHLALTNELIDGHKAEQYGLVTRVLPDRELLEQAGEIANNIAAHPPAGLANTKRAMWEAADISFEAALKAEERFEVDCFRTPETQSAFQAFVNRKK